MHPYKRKKWRQILPYWQQNQKLKNFQRGERWLQYSVQSETPVTASHVRSSSTSRNEWEFSLLVICVNVIACKHLSPRMRGQIWLLGSKLANFQPFLRETQDQVSH